MEKGLPSWRCVDIYDDEDIGRVIQVHQMLWGTGFIQLHKKVGRYTPDELEDVVVHYAFTRECDSDVLVSIPKFTGSWILDQTKSPATIESIQLDQDGRLVLSFGDDLGWVTIDAKPPK